MSLGSRRLSILDYFLNIIRDAEMALAFQRSIDLINNYIVNQRVKIGVKGL